MISFADLFVEPLRKALNKSWLKKNPKRVKIVDFLVFFLDLFPMNVVCFLDVHCFVFPWFCPSPFSGGTG